MSDKPDEFWTKEDIYDEQIHPLMSKIIAICKEHQIGTDKSEQKAG